MKTVKSRTIVVMALALILAFSDNAKAEENPNAGYKGGFFVKTSDDSFKFNIGGRLQPLVYYQRSSTANNWTFGIRRARMDFTTTINKKANIFVSILYSTTSSAFKAMNLYIATASYKFDPAFTLAVGTVGLPLGFKPSSAALLLIDPPICKTQKDGGKITPLGSPFGNPDGIGIEMYGDIGKFFYDLSVVNGAAEAKSRVVINDVNGTQTTVQAASGGVESNYDLNFNKKVSAGLRVGYNILDAVPEAEMDLPYSQKPKLTISMGGDYQGPRTDPNNNAEIKRILTGTTGVAFRWRGLAINTEIFGRKTKLDSLGTAPFGDLNLDDFGYYVNGGYFVVPNKFELAGSTSQIFRHGPHNDSYQFGGALNYYVHGNNLKIQLVYTLSGAYNDVTDESAVRTHFIGTMLTSKF